MPEDCRLNDLAGNFMNKLRASCNLLFHFAKESGNTCTSSIYANKDVKKQERDEPLLVVDADTLIYPDAMMVKLFNAVITNPTMLRPRRFFNVTCGADITLKVENMVILIFRAYFLSVLLGNNARTHCTSFIVTIIAGEHENTSSNSMIFTEVWPWDKLKHSDFDVNYEPSTGQYKVNDLYHWVFLIKYIVHHFTVKVFWDTLFLEAVHIGLKFDDDGLILVGLLIFIFIFIVAAIAIMYMLMGLAFIIFP